MTDVIGYFTDLKPHVQKAGSSPIFIGDEIGDNKYSGRNRVVAGVLFPYSNFRPEWTVIAGTWGASEGFLRESLAGGGSTNIRMSSKHSVGTWVVDASLIGGISDTNIVYYNFMWIDADNYYLMDMNATGALRLVRSTTDLGGAAIISTTWTADTGWHTMKITRDINGNFEIFLDGVSKGTVTNTLITTSNNIELGHYTVTTIQNAAFDNLKVN